MSIEFFAGLPPIVGVSPWAYNRIKGGVANGTAVCREVFVDLPFLGRETPGFPAVVHSRLKPIFRVSRSCFRLLGLLYIAGE